MPSRPESAAEGPNHYAYASVTGPGALNDLVQTLGLAPDEGWDRADIRQRGRVEPYGFSRWTLYSGLAQDEQINDHIDCVFKRLAPVESAFKSLELPWSPRLQVTGTFEDATTLLGISALNFRRAVLWGFDWDFDVYIDDMHDV